MHFMLLLKIKSQEKENCINAKGQRYLIRDFCPPIDKLNHYVIGFITIRQTERRV